MFFVNFGCMSYIKPRCIFGRYNVNNKSYRNLLKKGLLIFIFNYYLDKNFQLISYLLRIRDLKDRHSGTYLNLVLLEVLQEFDSEYNITK
jgi:hypothetical protein